MSTKQWSKYQNDIFNAVATTTDNLAVNAVAGSGKTTTIVEAARRIPGGRRVLFLAFNKHIVNELSARLPKGVDCKTIHSLGYTACAKGYTGNGRLTMDEHKYNDLVDTFVSNMRNVPPAVHGVFVKTVVSIINMSRLTLTNLDDAEAVDAMIAHYDMASNLLDAANDMEVSFDWLIGEALDTAKYARTKGDAMYRNRGVIDFTDMIYLPSAYSLPVWRYDVVLVDEAQDMSRAQLELVLRAAGATGRIIAVGDPRQAIQGFAGADNRSFDNIVTRARAKVMPLSVCYRCPTTHLDLAREIVPTIEAAPGAQPGTVTNIDLARFASMPRSGDLIICRVNAPLVGAALRLIAKGIQARVRGRNIGAQIAKMGKDASKIEIDPTIEAQGWRVAFAKRLDKFVQIRVDMLSQKKHTENAVEALQDGAECLHVYLEANPAINSLDALVSGIEGLFADEGAAVWLSSIHRSKGLEAERVFVLKPEKMALTWKGQLAWQAEQEQNLRYVGLTRAKKDLYFVHESLEADEGATSTAPSAPTDTLSTSTATSYTTTPGAAREFIASMGLL